MPQKQVREIFIFLVIYFLCGRIDLCKRENCNLLFVDQIAENFSSQSNQNFFFPGKCEITFCLVEK